MGASLRPPNSVSKISMNSKDLSILQNAKWEFSFTLDQSTPAEPDISSRVNAEVSVSGVLLPRLD